MKTALAATLIALVSTLSIPAIAADGHDGHGAMPSDMKMQSHAPADATVVEGTVTKIDKAAGKVTVSHGPLTNLNMPAMTMVFRVKDAAWLDLMKQDGKIRFVADSVGGSLTIVRFEAGK